MTEEKQKTPLTVYQAISIVQAGLAKEGISKDRSNTQQGYKFRGIDDIYNALAGLLADTGLCILPRVLSREVLERQTKSGGVLFYVTVDVEYDLISAHDGSKHTIRVFGEAMDSGDKATNKAMSAAYKYACLQAFSIPTEGDNDADGTTHEVTPAKNEQTIDTEQAANIDLMLNATKSDKAAFLKFFRVDDVRKLKLKDYQSAITMLNKKAEKAA